MKITLTSTFFSIFSFLLLVLGARGEVAALETISMNLAKPIWARNLQEKMNVTMGFRSVFGKPQDKPVILRVAASTIYRIWLNGKFLGHGPARAAHGFYRVDEWNLDDKLAEGQNLLAIEVAGYNANSYYLIDQPSFLQAEITAGSKTIVATVPSEEQGNLGEDVIPFAATILNYRVQKVRRFSFQRPFMESYRISPDSQRWLLDLAAPPAAVETEECAAKTLLKRRVPYADFAVQTPDRIVASGRVVLLDNPPKPTMGREMTNIGPKLKGFPISELETTPTLDLQRFESRNVRQLDRRYDGNHELKLSANDFTILEFKKNYTGMLGTTIACNKPARLWFLFDEVLSAGDVNCKRLGCANMIEFMCKPGTYSVETIEPYTLHYLKVVCIEGNCRVGNVYLRELAHPPVVASFHCSDDRLNRLFEAGVETFRQNALDIFMDCPSRERAGWLCDSFFTARVEKSLTGSNRIERNFLENFMLPDKFEFLPEGMLPMCYPADHYNGVFIPNWAMFFVLELDDYATRCGDRVMVDALRTKVMRLLDYFAKFENEDGLLEKLDSWVFVEWSEANRFVQDVNYPSNMLYAAMLDATARLYNHPELAEKAEKIRDVIRRQSFNGEFFVDNAVRNKDGILTVTHNCSEVCQYFAFFFDVASPQTYASLWQKLCTDFGPQRQKTNKYPEVHKANSFIGNVLRLELLSRAGRIRQILDESVDYLLFMADRTGTLWENDGAYASCNHGFASNICNLLLRDVLGICHIDVLSRKVKIRFADLDLQNCQGTIPTCDGPVKLIWQQKDGELNYQLDVPDGYAVEIENASGKKLSNSP